MPQGAILQDVPIQYATDMKGFLDLEYATDMKGLLVLQRLGPKRRANKPEPQVMKPIACFVLSHLKSRDVPWCPSCLVSRDVPRCVPPGVPPGVRPGVPWCPVLSRGVPCCSVVGVEASSNHMLKHSLGKGNGAYLLKNQASAVRLQPGMNPSLRICLLFRTEAQAVRRHGF